MDRTLIEKTISKNSKALGEYEKNRRELIERELNRNNVKELGLPISYVITLRSMLSEEKDLEKFVDCVFDVSSEYTMTDDATTVNLNGSQRNVVKLTVNSNSYEITSGIPTKMKLCDIIEGLSSLYMVRYFSSRISSDEASKDGSLMDNYYSKRNYLNDDLELINLDVNVKTKLPPITSMKNIDGQNVVNFEPYDRNKISQYHKFAKIQCLNDKKKMVK